MRYVLIPVEGVTEGGFVDELRRTRIGQAPSRYGKVEVKPLVLEGNQGYTKILDKADRLVREYLASPEACFQEEEENEVNKFLMFDYDDIEKKKIDIETLRKEAKERGYECIVTKPNSEFFVLALLKGTTYARKTKISKYIEKINMAIDELNARDLRLIEGFTEAIKIPPYEKNEHRAKDCFSALLTNHPELVDNILVSDITRCIDGKYSEIPKLIEYIDEVTGNTGSQPDKQRI